MSDRCPPGEVRFVNLPLMHEGRRSELVEALERTLDRGSYILGDEVTSFEDEFASEIGSKHAVGVGSGSDALELALRAVGVSRGDEVITAANTFFATVAAIEAIGARPILVDCEPGTLTIGPEAIQTAISSRTKAVVPVHLYGQMAPMAALRQLAASRHIVLVEDSCQAHGASRDGLRAGVCGAAAAFSFYPTKNLGALGDGGAVTTSDKSMYERLLLLRNYGSVERNRHQVLGRNSRLDAIQAAVLRVKLPHLRGWNEERRRIAARYRRVLEGGAQVSLPEVPAGSEPVYHQFVIRVRGDRTRLMRALSQRGIGTGVHYPECVHLQPAFAHLGYQNGEFPVAEAASREILSLPIYPGLRDDQVDYVAESVLEILGS